MRNMYMIFSLILVHSQTTVLTASPPNCRELQLISTPKIFPTFPTDSLDAMCTKLAKIFECVYSYQLSPPMKMTYQTQKNVIDYVCEYRQEYSKSQSCFQTPGLDTRIDLRCIRTQEFLRCGTDVLVSRCAADLVTSTDGCTTADADLMVKLTGLYYKPLKEFRKCPDATTVTTPTTAILSSATTPTKQSTDTVPPSTVSTADFNEYSSVSTGGTGLLAKLITSEDRNYNGDNDNNNDTDTHHNHHNHNHNHNHHFYNDNGGDRASTGNTVSILFVALVAMDIARLHTL